MALCRFALSGAKAFKACMRRDWTLMTRHGFIYIFRTCQVRSSVHSLCCTSLEDIARAHSRVSPCLGILCSCSASHLHIIEDARLM